MKETEAVRLPEHATDGSGKGLVVVVLITEAETTAAEAAAEVAVPVACPVPLSVRVSVSGATYSTVYIEAQMVL